MPKPNFNVVKNKMPKPGFTAITVSNRLKQRLTITARQLGLSVPRLIEEMLNANRLGTGMDSTVTNFHNGGISIIGQILIKFGSPGEIRTPVSGSKARYACPLHHRASLHMQLLFKSEIYSGYV